jgi:cell division septation protein DedD
VKASSRLKDSERVSRKLSEAQFKHYTLSLRADDKRMIHRVRLGPYSSRARAEEEMKRYQERFSKNRGAFIIKISAREAKGALK